MSPAVRLSVTGPVVVALKPAVALLVDLEVQVGGADVDGRSQARYRKLLPLATRWPRRSGSGRSCSAGSTRRPR